MDFKPHLIWHMCEKFWKLLDRLTQAWKNLGIGFYRLCTQSKLGFWCLELLLSVVIVWSLLVIFTCKILFVILVVVVSWSVLRSSRRSPWAFFLLRICGLLSRWSSFFWCFSCNVWFALVVILWCVVAGCSVCLWLLLASSCYILGSCRRLECFLRWIVVYLLRLWSSLLMLISRRIIWSICGCSFSIISFSSTSILCNLHEFFFVEVSTIF